jgi:hypothetical protein
MALHEEDNSEIATKIGPKRVEDHKMNTHEALGKVKNQVLQDEAFHSGVAFGGKSKGDSYTAGQIIQGWYELKDQLPDPRIGKVREGQSFPTKPLPASHAHGYPSVRTDRKPPERRSMSDFTNYGDEKGANALLYPPKSAYDGLPEEVFQRSRDHAEIRAIFTKIGMPATDTEFNNVVALATRHDCTFFGFPPLVFSTITFLTCCCSCCLRRLPLFIFSTHRLTQHYLTHCARANI